MVVPNGGNSRTKHSFVTFYNKEAERAIREYLGYRSLDKDVKLFPASIWCLRKGFIQFEKKTGVRIRPQVLRE